MDKIENPPAFPRTGEGMFDPKYDEAGMTLRDWFAGQALANAAEMSYAEYYGKGGNRDVRRMIAEHCYDIADAMLAAREGGDA